MKKKALILGTLLTVVLVLDIWSKRWALATLGPGARVHLLGGLVPLTLAYNQGAAFGIVVGNDPRLFFVPVTVVALGLLGLLYVRAERTDYLRLLSLGLVIAGALGNLLDRIRWDRGVVDFIGPINLGFMRWPIFNVADSAITCGAILLALSFWLEEERHPHPEPDPGEGRADDGRIETSPDAAG